MRKMNNLLTTLLVVFLAIILLQTESTHSVELENNNNKSIRNTTESVNFQIEQADDDYPSDSYYYDNYEATNNEINPDQIDKKQLFLNTNVKQTNNKTNSNAAAQQQQQPQIIKQLENNLNSLIKQSNSNQSSAAYDYADHEALEDVVDTNTSGENNDEDLSETEDVSHVVIINAEHESDYQVDDALKTNDLILKSILTTTTHVVPGETSSVVSLNNENIINNEKKATHDVHLTNDHKQTDFKSKEIASNKNYLTFIVIVISIGVVLTGLSIVIILFVKRRSLLLKSKCQIVSKAKGQQSYTSVGQNDF